MGTGGIFFYKLVSPYSNDVTKNCKLTVNEIDSNFLVLKDADIDTAEYDEASRVLVLTRNNGEKLIVDLGNVTNDLAVDKVEDENGVTLNISYSDKDGEHSVSLEHVITKENLMDFVSENVLTRVITDDTLKGSGTLSSPLGLNGVEKTGTLAPAKAVIDLTDGGRLPSVSSLGTRYVTLENVHDYGFLYNQKGVEKINARLEAEGAGWRVPTKSDWDALLNSIEPCEYQNHDSAKCHVELGHVAGKFLKSECGWENQYPCDCNGNKPLTCTTNYNICDPTSDTPCVHEDGEWNDCGVDKYGMAIRPSGEALIDSLGKDVYRGFGAEGIMWTTTHVCDDVDQDIYTKEFVYDKGGVVQEAQCPSNFYSVRLVKDYSGDNYFDSEYIDGLPYKTVLFPQSKQVWIASNFASTEGFIGIDDVRNGDYGLPLSGRSIDDVEYLKVNNGEGIKERKVYFINEWNGEYWNKKAIGIGNTIVIEEASCVIPSAQTKTVCWIDSDEFEHCVDVEIPSVEQSNLEYRVYADDECDQELVNTDDIVTERLVSILVPILDKERIDRIAADEALDEKIDASSHAHEEVEAQLWEAINNETAAREEVEGQLWTAINNETAAREEVEGQIWEAINNETAAREEVEGQIWEAINNETAAREEVEGQLWTAINNETAAREEVEGQLWTAINDESVARQEVDNQQWDAIVEESATRERVDNEQWDAINNEIARAESEEARIEGLTIKPLAEPYKLKMSSEEGENLVLESRDGNGEHFIRIIIDGSFGEI